MAGRQETLDQRLTEDLLRELREELRRDIAQRQDDEDRDAEAQPEQD
jgi:hypothetical protein